MRRARYFCLIAALGLSCQRKAPGPDECLAFAYDALGVTRQEQLLVARVRQHVDELTRSCLSTPFDRELLQCVQRTRQMSGCSVLFRARRAASR